MDSELAESAVLDPAKSRILRALPLRERSLLSLIYRRGASPGEIAGLLGVRPRAVRTMQQQALRRATDPLLAAVLAIWRSLSAEDRRLAYLHHMVGLPVREIARSGLLDNLRPGDSPRPTTCFSTVQERLDRIERQAQRAVRRKERRGADGLPSRGGPEVAR